MRFAESRLHVHAQHKESQTVSISSPLRSVSLSSFPVLICKHDGDGVFTHHTVTCVPGTQLI